MVTSLWRKKTSRMSSHVSWEHVRECDTETAERWLTLFQKDEPDSEFVISETKPKGKKGPKVFRGPGSEY